MCADSAGLPHSPAMHGNARAVMTSAGLVRSIAAVKKTVRGVEQWGRRRIKGVRRGSRGGEAKRRSNSPLGSSEILETFAHGIGFTARRLEF